MHRLFMQAVSSQTLLSMTGEQSFSVCTSHEHISTFGWKEGKLQNLQPKSVVHPGKPNNMGT